MITEILGAFMSGHEEEEARNAQHGRRIG
jgi:hypothetical protein